MLDRWGFTRNAGGQAIAARFWGVLEFSVAVQGVSRPVAVPVRPITLIYGENSSGKTSLLQSLLLEQWSTIGEDAPLLAPQGHLVNLGSYREPRTATTRPGRWSTHFQ